MVFTPFFFDSSAGRASSDVFAPINRAVADIDTPFVDMAVTADRVILLDSQPVLSGAVLSRMIRNEAPFPAGITSFEQLLRHTTMQIITFMLTVCHVVIVAQSNLVEEELWR